MQTTNITNETVNNFMSSFCPFGWHDCKAAIEAAIESGHDYQWAVDQIVEFCDSTGSKLSDIDPCYCVYDAILQEARTQLDNLMSFDIMNDASFDTYGNFMCTSYDYKEESKEALIEKLAENDIIIEQLEDSTQYFLSQVEISQEDINKAKEALTK